MTSSASAHGPSATTLASLSATEDRPWTFKILAAAAVGVFLGALLGSAFFRILGSDSTATALVRISEPVDLVALAGGAFQSTPNTQENLQSYASGEVAYLSDEGFAQAVGEKLGKSEPPQLDVMQGGDTTVVMISSSSASASDAIRTVATALDLYRQQIAQRTDQQLRAVLPVLDEWERDATPDRVQEIQGLRNRVLIQSSPANHFTVLQTPTVNAVTSQRARLGGLLGAVLGGAVAPLLVMGRRRRLGRLASDPEIADALDGALDPAVDLRRCRGVPVGEKQAALARTLWAQLPVRRPNRVVVVIGASRLSGTEAVTSLLAFAAGETESAETITLAGAGNEVLQGPADGGAVTVIDAGALGDSPLVPRALSLATEVVLVARFGVDSVTKVLALCSAVSSAGAPIIAVFTHRSGRLRPHRRTRASGPAGVEV
ncbi:hypothetical protein MPNTM1_01960 [Mycolicibacterium parafortuitum]|uniref:hypothetical protein n=1 Tax=Mycolicibacterium parafortuitum TaxID=39692 RepID=UPI0032C420FF